MSLTVDIVINNFNYGRFLTEAVDSALAQSHPEVNVIVVDDGSTDESRDLLRAYEGRVELVFKANGGQASALNAGAARCTGDVVMFLDADDVLDPDAAARVAAAFAADPRIGKVQSRMRIVDAEGRWTGEVKPPAYLPLPVGDLRHAEVAFPFDIVWLPTSANAYRADVLRRVLPIPEDAYPRCADWYLNHTTTLLGRVLSLDDINAAYRLHGSNNYEPQEQTLDLDHVRETIGYAVATTREITRLADELGLPRPDRILSLSDLANRLVSLRLERSRHPLPADRVWRVLADAVRAVMRRHDVSLLMKVAFAGWFLLAAVSPRPAVRRLAEYFLFHGRRRRLNALIQRMHRVQPPRQEPEAAPEPRLGLASQR